MRLLPPVPLQFRVAQEETSLGGALIPQHSRICVATYLIDRAPEIDEDPDRFVPERWIALQADCI